MSSISKVLPEGYGYVVLVGVESLFVNAWMAFKVSKARKQYDVPYPIMYHHDNVKFNCIQRVHQNTLEGHPSFLLLLLISGLQYPKVSAAAGGVYLLGRIAYALGYYTGVPDKRVYGVLIGYLGLLPLLGGAVCFAAHQLKWCNK